MRTAQREFWIRNLGQRSSGDSVDVDAAYGLVTLGTRVHIGTDETGIAAPVTPNPRDYRQRPAWVVWFRVVGASFSCPAMIAGRTPRPIPADIRAHLGWRVFILPDHLDAALSYDETAPWGCGGITGGSGAVAWQHVGLPWRIVRRTHGKAVFRYTLPPCGHLDSAGGSGGPEWRIAVVAAVPFGHPPCPPPAEYTITFDIPDDAHIVSGRTGPLS